MNDLIYEERLSDSPYIDKVMRGITVADASVTRPASSHWYLVFSTWQGRVRPLVVGPWLTSGVTSWIKDAEVLWIRFKLGTFMPHLPTVNVRDAELLLPEASSRSFWLKSSAWEFPNYGNADTFVDRLVREELLVTDPVVKAALMGQIPPVADRTVRHRFLQVTGQSQNHILQLQRVERALALLQQGHSIQDVVFQTGYADQPHLTRYLKQLTGYTPAQVAHQSA